MYERDTISRIGNVNLSGHDEILWSAAGHLSATRQHEAELSEIQLQIKDAEIRRLFEVDPEFRADGDIILFNGVILRWEHESSCELNLKQIRDKMDKYADVPVIWTCKLHSWIDKLARFCHSDKHLFTSFELAVEDFHGPIWVDRNGTKYPLPFPREQTNT